MTLQSGKNLTPIFEKVAFSRPGFATQRALFSVKKMFLDKVGLLPKWAIGPDVIIPKLAEILPQRHMTPMNAAAFLCALSVKHVHSFYDPVSFLGNFLKLYNAKTFDEVCEIEEIAPKSSAWYDLNDVRNGSDNTSQKRGTRSQQLEAIKIRCWANDLADAHNPKKSWFSFAIPEKKTKLKPTLEDVIEKSQSHQPITVEDIEVLLKSYPSYKDQEEVPELVGKLKESDGRETYSAFPRDDYLGMLRKMRAKDYINETQCGIILCFILHSREKRNDKRTSYVTHPMAVANLVRKYGDQYLDDTAQVWMATLAALLHDGGEESNIDLENDLMGLLPPPTIEAIKALHKKDKETYFGYLERCADNTLASMVKLCDIYHNSSDAGTDPGFKQGYVYPIAAAYVEYRLKNKDEKLSVKEFVKRTDICSFEIFEKIEKFTENRQDKKKRARDFRDILGDLRNIGEIRNIFAEETITEEAHFNANPRGKENTSLHL